MQCTLGVRCILIHRLLTLPYSEMLCTLLSPIFPQSEPLLHISTHVRAHAHAHTHINSTPEVYKPLTFSHDFPCPLFQSLIRFSHTHAFVNPSALKDTQQLAFTKSSSVQLLNLPKVQEAGIRNYGFIEFKNRKVFRFFNSLDKSLLNFYSVPHNVY